MHEWRTSLWLADQCNLVGVRDSAANRANFAVTLFETYSQYLSSNFGLQLPAPKPLANGDSRIVDNNSANNDPAWGKFTASTNWLTGTNSQQYGNNIRFVAANPTAVSTMREFFFYIGTAGIEHRSMPGGGSGHQNR